MGLGDPGSSARRRGGKARDPLLIVILIYCGQMEAMCASAVWCASAVCASGNGASALCASA